MKNEIQADTICAADMASRHGHTLRTYYTDYMYSARLPVPLPQKNRFQLLDFSVSCNHQMPTCIQQQQQQQQLHRSISYLELFALTSCWTRITSAYKPQKHDVSNKLIIYLGLMCVAANRFTSRQADLPSACLKFQQQRERCRCCSKSAEAKDSRSDLRTPC